MRGINLALACILCMYPILALPEARAEMKTETVEYKAGETACEGVLVYDATVKGKRPAVLVVHDWMGVGGETKRRAEMLAGLGYAAFCADVYGKDVRPKDRQEAGAAAGKIKKDRDLMLARLNAALDTFLKNENVDPKRVAAIGYCFGGTCVLELARSGAGLAGVVSFHGGLGTTVPAKEGQIKAKVLALNGADDPSSAPEAVNAFEKEMREAKADWQCIAYGGAVHAFTNPAAGNDNSKGAAYNEKADIRSWDAMQVFLREAFFDVRLWIRNDNDDSARLPLKACRGFWRMIYAAQKVVSDKEPELKPAAALYTPSRNFNVAGIQLWDDRGNAFYHSQAIEKLTKTIDDKNLNFEDKLTQINAFLIEIEKNATQKE